MNNLHKIGLGLMLLILAACQNKEKVYKDHYPADKQEFITDIQDRFNKIKATEGLVSKDSTATLIREAHLHFYHHYPVYYDWWLQDGSDVKWFDKTLPEQISERLQKLQQETKVTNTPESITQALSAYLDACKARREQRLGILYKKHSRSRVSTNSAHFALPFSLIRKVCRMPAQNATSLLVASWLISKWTGSGQRKKLY